MSYFKLSQTSGQSGTSTLSVTAEANTGRLSRTGLVTVSAGSVSRTVSLTQKGAGLTAELDTGKLSFPSTDEGTVVLEGTTNAQKITVGISNVSEDGLGVSTPLWCEAVEEYGAVVDGEEKTLTLGEDGGDTLGASASYRFKIAFKAQANTDAASRSGVFGIVFSGKDDNGLEAEVTRNVTVEQPGVSLEVSPSELDYEAEGGDKDITVTSDKDWTASIS